MGGKREIFCKKLDKCIIRSIKIHNCTHPWKIFSHADQNILFHLFLNLWNVFSFLILISSTWPGLINLEASLNKENAQVTVWKKKLFPEKITTWDINVTCCTAINVSDRIIIYCSNADSIPCKTDLFGGLLLQISIIERCILRPIESFNMDVIAWNSCDLVCMQMPEKTIGMQRWHKEDETTMFTTSASL